MAGDSPVPGIICAAPDIPFSNEQIAGTLNLKPKLLLDTIPILEKHNKIERNGTGCIEIVNWYKYQPRFDKDEYQAQYMREYRAKQKESPNSEANECKSNIRNTNTREGLLLEEEGEGRGSNPSPIHHPNKPKGEKLNAFPDDIKEEIADIMDSTKEQLNPTSYDYWFNKLLEDKDNRHIPILANAFCALTGKPMPTERKAQDGLVKRIAAAYRDCRNDAYEVLVGIRDLKDRNIEGDTLNYLIAMLHKRQGGE